jgi:hypothetical protein
VIAYRTDERMSYYRRARTWLNAEMLARKQLVSGATAYLRAGPGAFACTVIGGQSGARQYVYARAGTARQAIAIEMVPAA